MLHSTSNGDEDEEEEESESRLLMHTFCTCTSQSSSSSEQASTSGSSESALVASEVKQKQVLFFLLPLCTRRSLLLTNSDMSRIGCWRDCHIHRLLPCATRWRCCSHNPQPTSQPIVTKSVEGFVHVALIWKAIPQ